MGRQVREYVPAPSPGRAGLIHGYVRLVGIHADILRIVNEYRGNQRSPGRSFIHQDDLIDEAVRRHRYGVNSIRAAISRLHLAGFLHIAAEYRQPFGGMPQKAWSIEHKKRRRVIPQTDVEKQRAYRERKRIKLGRTEWNPERRCWQVPSNQVRVNSIFNLAEYL